MKEYQYKYNQVPQQGVHAVHSQLKGYVDIKYWFSKIFSKTHIQDTRFI